MTEDLANIEATKRAIDDIRFDIEKLERMYDALDNYKGVDQIDKEFAKAYAERIHLSLTDQRQIRDLLAEHLKGMGGR